MNTCVFLSSFQILNSLFKCLAFVVLLYVLLPYFGKFLVNFKEPKLYSDLIQQLTYY